MVLVNVHELETGVLVAMVVQFERDRFGLDCSVTRKYGVVLRTSVTELVFVLEMLVNAGAVGVGNSPTSPLNVTPALEAKARPSIALVEFMVMA